ncbi:DUF6588 family protein [Ekhidna sp. To15]|uniref:DUF6588 family protein n=1 Tax=Ekhidna sp. To15 TaxID=3395267 RepID=UPI003F51C2C4
MKKSTTKLFMLMLVVSFAVNHSAKSQDFGNVFQAGPEDAELYLQSYVDPIMQSFNNGLSGGWVNTAKTHKLLGFDLTVSANIANIPNSDKQFLFRNLDFQNLELAGGQTESSLPTAVGGPTNTQLTFAGDASIGDLQFSGNSDPFNAAEGYDTEDLPIAGFPVPTFHIGIGLVKNTDLKIRFVPSIETDDLSFNMWGVGVLHDVKQWIPGLKLVPVDIAAFVGHTSLKAEYDIDESGTNGGIQYDADGTAEFKATSTIIQIMASKKLAFLTPYFGLGYNIAGSSFKVNGTFVYDDIGNPITQPEEFIDPIDLSFGGGSSPRVTIGARIKLLILTLHADYSIQKYNTFTLGAGISIR